MICEFCKAEHSGEYGSGRFCSMRCARAFSTKTNRAEINRKVSSKLKGRKQTVPKSKESIDKQRASLKRSLKLKFKDQMVICGDDKLINITKSELEDYRLEHTVCEICGHAETLSTKREKTTPNKLSVDHDHATSKFRGLLCHNCNSRLGWYENHKAVIDKYLERGRMAELVDAEDLKSSEGKTS